MNEVLVNCTGVERPYWLNKVPPFCQRVLEHLGIDGWEVSLLLCDDDTIRDLNSRYRGIDRPTDILSFGQGNIQSDKGQAGKPIPVGDIVIALDTLKSQARELRITQEQELKRLLIHGILHLKGMKHRGENSRMIKIQEEILKTLQRERIF
jgi:probable rRNA maturation factor